MTDIPCTTVETLQFGSNTPMNLLLELLIFSSNKATKNSRDYMTGSKAVASMNDILIYVYLLI